MKLTGDERQERILCEVMARGEASVADLAALLGVTTETIRKDLSILQDKNAIEKRHGFVTLPSTYGEASFADKEARHREEKAAIARIAAGLIPSGASVIMEASTTNLQLAKMLVMRSDLTVFTNSLNICQVLGKSGNELYMVGGAFRQRSNSCTGTWAQQAISGLNADVAFLGCDGFSADGPTVAFQQLLEVDRAIIGHSRLTYLLSDTSKLVQTGLYDVAGFSDFDALIFERPLTADERRMFPDKISILPE